jgi:hypothetical protein
VERDAIAAVRGCYSRRGTTFRLSALESMGTTACEGVAMAMVAIDRESAAETLARRDNDPVTLHRTMQMMIGKGLREPLSGAAEIIA